MSAYRFLSLAVLIVALMATAARAAEPAAAKDDDARVRELIGQLDGADMGSRVRAQRAVKELVKIGKPAVPALVTATGDKSLWMRLWGLAALCEIGDARAVEPALALMQDGEPLVRTIAVWHGSRFVASDPRVAAAVVKHMGDEDRDVRKWARRAIIDRKIEGAEPQLRAFLDDASGAVRVDVFITLAMLAHKELRVAALETIASDKAPRHRATALWVLQNGRPDEGAAEPLLAALDDGDAEVQDAAVQGLDWLLKEGTRPPDAGEAKHGRAVLSDALVKRVQDAVEAKLPAMLASKYAPLRAHALYLLAAARREALLPQMQAALRDPEPVVREYALRALARAQLKDRRTLEPALAALNDEDVDVRVWAYKAVLWVTDGRMRGRFMADAPEAERRAQAEKLRAECKPFLGP